MYQAIEHPNQTQKQNKKITFTHIHTHTYTHTYNHVVSKPTLTASLMSITNLLSDHAARFALKSYHSGGFCYDQCVWLTILINFIQLSKLIKVM